MATADRMERDRKGKRKVSIRDFQTKRLQPETAAQRAARARKERGTKRSTARSVGRTVSKATSSAARGAAMRKRADARSGRSTTSPRMAEVYRSATNALTRIPGIQDKNSAANRNARSAATKVVQSSRARVAAEKGGTQRSRSALARVNRRRTTKVGRKK